MDLKEYKKHLRNTAKKDLRECLEELLAFFEKVEDRNSIITIDQQLIFLNRLEGKEDLGVVSVDNSDISFAKISKVALNILSDLRENQYTIYLDKDENKDDSYRKNKLIEYQKKQIEKYKKELKGIKDINQLLTPAYGKKENKQESIEDFIDKQLEIAKSPKCIIIKGEAGQGKSTLALKVLNKYTQEEEIIHFIKGKELSSWDALKTDIRGQLEKDIKRNNKVGIPKENELIFVDGLDEILNIEEGESIRSTLNNTTLFEKNHIIITSRKIFNEINASSFIELDLAPWDSDNLTLMVQRMDWEGIYKEHIDQKEFLLEKVGDEKNDLFNIFSKTPLLLALIVEEGIDAKSIGEKEALLIEEILQVHFEKQLIGEKENHTQKKLKEVSYNNWVDFLQLLAFNIHNGQIIDAKACLQSNDWITVKDKSFFKDIGLFGLKMNSGKIHSFQNVFVQQYLNAKYIWDKVKQLHRKDSTDKPFLMGIQLLFQQKKYEPKIWDYIKDMIEGEKEFSIIEEIHHYIQRRLNFTLKNQSLLSFDGETQDLPINKAINIFIAYWKLLNLTNQSNFPLKIREHFSNLLQLISLVRRLQNNDSFTINNCTLIGRENKEKEDNDFEWQKLSHLKIESSNFTNLKFFHCNLSNNIWEGITFDNVTFSNCVLSESTFIDCKFKKISFFNCTLNKISIDASTIDLFEVEECIIGTETKSGESDDGKYVNFFKNIKLDYIESLANQDSEETKAFKEKANPTLDLLETTVLQCSFSNFMGKGSLKLGNSKINSCIFDTSTNKKGIDIFIDNSILDNSDVSKWELDFDVLTTAESLKDTIISKDDKNKLANTNGGEFGHLLSISDLERYNPKHELVKEKIKTELAAQKEAERQRRLLDKERETEEEIEPSVVDDEDKKGKDTKSPDEL